ncbi:hypothetical protein BaRGS_00036466 [Batillaria attramentaria]|uniref:Granulins domain-containing protein n=1 Tax=Batillaria attramentaria TaxID=370345 RepID=A0ABD0JBT4_9CAEN
MKWWLVLSCLVPCAMVVRAQEGSVKCDDGEQCPDKTTCCKLARETEYGCCPMPSAVCCSDKIHCCPSGSKCDVSSGTCVQTDNVLRFFRHGQAPTVKRFPAHKLESKEPEEKPLIIGEWEAGLPMEEFRPKATECPDGETECPSTSTCCLLKSGSYGCCDGKDAVCCSDGQHCCPQGYTCDEKRQACTSASRGLTFRWVDKKPVRARPIPKVTVNVTCLDKKTVCLENDTCCNATKDYGCCPLAHAVCCLDKRHCCPVGTVCDIPHQRCYKKEDDVEWEQPWVERRRPDASPAGKVRENSSSVFGKSRSSVFGKGGGVTCQDGQMCQDGQTCCQLENGSYGCCSFPDKVRAFASRQNHFEVGYCNMEAVCCSDHVHCCPHACTCDFKKEACVGGWVEHKWSKIIRPRVPDVTPRKIKQSATHSSVTCPDGSQCPDSNTCCKMQGGQYGCCSLPNAVCCSDHVHCCPTGYKCNLQEQKCTKGPDTVAWVEKRPAMKSSLALQDRASVVCPSGAQCPAGQTCCKLTTGKYGCCPMPKAVCCSDGVHCCPNGYTCDVSTGRCQKGEDIVAWVAKQPAQERSLMVERAESVVCPDGRSECPDGNTCCKLSTGQYGCCPFPKAVCCSDGVHCCPNGYTCDVSTGRCQKGKDIVAWVAKQPAQERSLTVSVSVVCPGGESQCPAGQTCCKVSSGGYGCCPLPQAMCCSDGVHCCPNGYTCDVSTGRCQKGEDIVAWVAKQPAQERSLMVERAESVVCPDSRSECPDGNTCCKLSTGQYGCCPLPKAMCCSDGVHCCPNGYTCDVSTGRCQKGKDIVAWVAKQPAQERSLTVSVSVVCPGGESQCPAGSTCCELSSGGYGCCPLPQAVCCSDGVHCCPNGYTCDVSTGRCQKGEDIVAWVAKQPAQERYERGSLVQMQLIKQRTCAGRQQYRKVPSRALEVRQNVVMDRHAAHYPLEDMAAALGQRPCAALTNSTVVPMDLHVTCPQESAHTVNLQFRGSGNSQHSRGEEWLGAVRLPSLSKVSNVICPDQQSECPDQNTCCITSSGTYGCCPQPNAVCCADKLHCCPQGYKCDTSSGKCLRGLVAIPWEMKKPAFSR